MIYVKLVERPGRVLFDVWIAEQKGKIIGDWNSPS